MFELYFPEAEITLWPGRLGHGSKELLTRSFPQLRIAEGSLDSKGLPDTPELAKAWENADLYVSGSGSGFPAHAHAVAFKKATGKPTGVFGVSTDPISGVTEGRAPAGGTLREIRAKAARLSATHLTGILRTAINEASFMFCRDTITRDYLRSQGLGTPLIEFGPDAQLGMHLRDDRFGASYLGSTGLQPNRFICVIPRLRYTPTYRVNETGQRSTLDDLRDAINERSIEKDHAKLRELIVAYVRQTGNRVLACPEMTYQVELAKTKLLDPLPDDVKRQVVWRDSFWMPDEAAAVYAKAQAVVSLECRGRP